ncbi:MAG: FecR domain-containing protein [Magnetococcus sp. YQC-9]
MAKRIEMTPFRPLEIFSHTLQRAQEGVQVDVPGDEMLLKAEFIRHGQDLLLRGTGEHAGQTVLVPDYFRLSTPPDLYTVDGARIPGDLALRLAGPVAPGLYAEAAASANQTGIGTVDTVSGEASIMRGGVKIPVTQGMALMEGDVVQTGEKGSVGLIYADKSTVALGDNGRLVIEKMEFDPTAGTGKSSTSVVQGVFTFTSGAVAKMGPNNMVFKTPVAEIGIRGTTVAGHAQAEGKENTITLLKDADGGVGQISVSNSAGTQILSQINQTTALKSFNVAPAQPFIMPANQIAQRYGAATKALPPPQVIPTFKGDPRQQDAQGKKGEKEGEKGKEGEKKEGKEGEKKEGEGEKKEGEGEKKEGEGEKKEGEGEKKEGEAKEKEGKEKEGKEKEGEKKEGEAKEKEGEKKDADVKAGAESNTEGKDVASTETTKTSAESAQEVKAAQQVAQILGAQQDATLIGKSSPLLVPETSSLQKDLADKGISAAGGDKSIELLVSQNQDSDSEILSNSQANFLSESTKSILNSSDLNEIVSQGTQSLTTASQTQIVQNAVQMEETKVETKTETPIYLPPVNGSKGFKVADDYLVGAKVYIDVNGDGKNQDNEYVGDTGVHGAVNLSLTYLPSSQTLTIVGQDSIGYHRSITLSGISSFDGALPKNILVVGGKEETTGIVNKMTLKAEGDAKIVNPLTTLVQEYLAHNPAANADQAESVIKRAFGLPDIDLSTFDPLESPTSSAAIAMQKVIAQVGTIAQYVNGDTATAKMFDSLFSAIEDMPEGAHIDLSNSETLSAVLMSTGEVSSEELNKIVAVNAKIQSATSMEGLGNQAPIGEVLVKDPEGDVIVTASLLQNETITVSADTLEDPDGINGDIIYVWKANGTVVSESNYNSLVLTQELVGKTITVEATYTDDRGKEEIKVSEATITVANVNDAPEITSASEINYFENNTGVAYQATANDPDGTPVTWTISGVDAEAFTLSSNGAVSFKSVPSYESPSDVGADHIYTITLTASDGELSDTQDVTIEVKNVNEAPTVTSGSSASFYERATGKVYQASANDPDVGDTLSWWLGGVDANQFTISSTGAVTFRSTPDFEAPVDAGGNNVYDITVYARDNHGTSSDGKAVTITVNNVNELSNGQVSIVEVTPQYASEVGDFSSQWSMSLPRWLKTVRVANSSPCCSIR